jgi:hypothetical protein
MNAEFNWWLLIVGIGAGVAVTWLVLSDLGRREEDLTDRERAAEAEVLADELARQGRPTALETVERVLTLHRAYVDGALRPLVAIDDDPAGRVDAIPESSDGPADRPGDDGATPPPS